MVFQIGLKTEAKKKAVWMDCGIHAREWIAPAFCQYFVRQVREPSEKRKDVQHIECSFVLDLFIFCCIQKLNLIC